MAYMFFRNAAFNQNINTKPITGTTNYTAWDTSKVTNMNFMFYRAKVFNGDLSGWCVSQFVSAPTGFKDDANPLWTNPALQPKWVVVC
jgi:hypothetical protein